MDCVEERKTPLIEHEMGSNLTANIILEHAYSEDNVNRVKQNDSMNISSSSSSSLEELIDKTDEVSTKTLVNEEKSEITKPAPEKVKSRELKSLLDAAKESNLDTNIVHKRRKSVDRSLDSGGKRAMRSQNPEFLARHKKFLHKVNKFDINSDGVVQDNDMQSQKKDKDTSLLKTPKRKKESFSDDAVGGSSVEDVKKRRKSLAVDILNINMKKDKDSFCWRCHREGILIQCETCPRGYHARCLKQPVLNPDRWPCPECLAILQAESTKTRSPALRDMSLEHLCELLKYAVKRMIGCTGSEPFIHPVDSKAFPDYRNYVVQPMDLTTLQNNIRNNLYGSTIAFMADAKWILHNSIIYNSYQSKLTSSAKSIIKICKQEMAEIETCSECYQNANTKKNSWFIEVCSKPHILLWAKLKGFPYWPAKAMTTNPAGLVDVRFFGAHDRAWIPVKECFLYSSKDPNTTNKNKRNNIAECIKEVDIHIQKLKEKFGEFYYAPYRTPYDPSTELDQLSFMLPKYVPSAKVKSKLASIKIFKSENGEEDIKPIRKRSKSRPRVPSRARSRSRARSEVRSECDDESEVFTPSSKTSVNSDDKEKSLNFSNQDFDKFMEGYGTEDDDLVILDTEARKKIIKSISDSESDESLSKTLNSTSSIADDIKNGSDETYKDDEKSENMLDSSLLSRGKVRTRGGYHNVTGKLKVIGRRKSETMLKRSLTNSPNLFETPTKLARRNSDISIKSDSSRLSGISDKINKFEELPDTLELSVANTSTDVSTVSISDNISSEKISRPEFVSTLPQSELDKLKPVAKNKEFNISPQNKSVSIADRLIKKITESEQSTDLEKIESVKKQILDNLESSSTDTKKDNSENNEDVSSSDNKNEKKADTEKSINETENNQINKEVTAKINSENTDKNQNVSSSTETIPAEPETNDKSEEILGETNNSLEKVIEKVSETVVETDQTSDKNLEKEKKENENSVDAKKNSVEIIEDKEMEVDSKSETSDSEDNEPLISHNNKVVQSQVKLVNVSDIISGKIDGQVQPESTNLPELPQSITESVDIKSEPPSDIDEPEIESNGLDKQPQYDVTLTVVDKQKKKPGEMSDIDKTGFKIVDNMTRIIDSVASNYSNEFNKTNKNKNSSLALNKKEISLRPISKLIQSPKQKARKSFPNSPHKMQSPVPFKKMLPEKKDSAVKPQSNVNLKVVSTLHNISTQITSTPSVTATTSASSVNKDTYLTSTSTPVMNNMALLPPNQPITLTQNAGNPILAMVHHGINTPSLPIQQNSSISTSMQIQASNNSPNIENCSSTTNVFTQSQTSESNETSGIPESITKAIGELFCKPPPKLKPRPPGPLSKYYDEGSPSSVGPTTSLINSVSHRLTDYFRGLLKETLHDLSSIGDPESKIRSLELEIESLKHKHAEEMLELRKNISSILKDIQKSLVEEKAKLVDETRAACEAERLRCVEEAKSKQWCAFCFKEAQFYCCWNTSYCDYPCQQKHWSTHMKTCSQSTIRTLPSVGSSSALSTAEKPPVNSTNNKQTPKQYINSNNKTLIKSTRMIVKQTNKQGVPMYVPVQRPVQGGQQTITLVESTPGNFEIVGNHGPISLGGKLVPTTTIKVKPGNLITVASSSNSNTTTTGSQKTIIVSQKPQMVGKGTTESKT